MDKKQLLNYGIIFLLVYIVLSVFIFPREAERVPTGADFDVVSTSKEYEQGSLVAIKISNNTEHDATILNDCPSEPLAVQGRIKGEWQSVTHVADMNCEDTADTVIPAGSEVTIDYRNWNNGLFNELGLYKVAADITVESDASLGGTYESNEFEIKPQGFLGYIWTAGFYQPIFNALIGIASVIPGHDLGWAIVILTILFRTVLLIPSQRAMKSQRRLQEIQPKLNKIRDKYKGNQEKIAQETMMLWKQHKVNPMGSCLPLLIQLPILIGLFYVIQTGLSPDNTHLLYGGLKGFSLLDIQTNFLGILELTEINFIALPLLVGGLQFAQMKLAMMRRKKKDEEKSDKKKSEMEMASKMMVYFMPVLIAVFTASVPAGVGLYWMVSTLYGIGQQLVVNKQVEDEASSVKVIKSNKS